MNKNEIDETLEELEKMSDNVLVLNDAYSKENPLLLELANITYYLLWNYTKSLIALKTRNAIIFSPHPRAKNSTIEAARIVLEAAVKAGAPEDIIGWIDVPSIELSSQLMHHENIDCILATGGPGMVKAAYSSGNPALGVGPGNTPAVIDETADIQMAVSYILMSKTFDNGMICAS